MTTRVISSMCVLDINIVSNYLQKIFTYVNWQFKSALTTICECRNEKIFSNVPLKTVQIKRKLAPITHIKLYRSLRKFGLGSSCFIRLIGPNPRLIQSVKV